MSEGRGRGRGKESQTDLAWALIMDPDAHIDGALISMQGSISGSWYQTWAKTKIWKLNWLGHPGALFFLCKTGMIPSANRSVERSEFMRVTNVVQGLANSRCSINGSIYAMAPICQASLPASEIESMRKGTQSSCDLQLSGHLPRFLLSFFLLFFLPLFSLFPPSPPFLFFASYMENLG